MVDETHKRNAADEISDNDIENGAAAGLPEPPEKPKASNL